MNGNASCINRIIFAIVILLTRILFVFSVINRSEDSATSHRVRRKAIKHAARLWPNGVVPYSISDTFSQYDCKNKFSNEIDKICIMILQTHVEQIR